ncbi:uncharacterized protein [Gossypium hirsutum]|uniref:Uncharacterized protein n=1 Tax=Gossypium hirsutum TaxID=3635 RepID=A0A1U8L1M4_GOSHI|nr:uncharacterized protein LOC107921613 [Gossypium hirsutum]
MTGEMIENAVSSDKIDAGESTKRPTPRKKENEVNNTSTYSKGHSKSLTVNQPKTPPYPKWYDANAQYEYHAGITWRSIENCTTFKKLVERFIQMGIVKFDDAPSIENPLPNHTNNGVNAISKNMRRTIKADITKVKTLLRWVWKEMAKRGLVTSNPEGSCEEIRNYYEFHHEEGYEVQECVEFRALVQGLMDNKEIEFCEKVKEEGSICTKRVSWNYYCNVTIPKKENLADASRQGQDVGSYTRSRRRYDSVDAKAEPAKGKATVVEQKKERIARPESPVNEPVNEEEAKEFLKFLKHSEYSVVEQLRSEQYKADNFIFFNDDKIPPDGVGSAKALHITTCCKGYTLPGVLIDNESALNVLPLSTLNRLPVDSSHMKTCQNIVRAFNGTERRVMGKIEISLLIGPNTYKVDFLVMDIKPLYNCLLGRPWIHSAGAVPSSLHQKLKLVSEGRQVIINTEEDIIAAVTSDGPYSETSDEVIECSFRSLEFFNVTFITEGYKIPVPKMSKTTWMGLQLTVGK